MDLKKRLAAFFCFRNYATLAFIFFCFSLFIDATWIFKRFSIVSKEALLWTVLANGAFLAFSVLAALKRKSRERTQSAGAREYLPLLVTMAIVAAVMISGYYIIEMYDAHLYYGSFIKAIELYNLKMRTAIGAYNLWGKLFIGSALFVAPFEYLFYKKMIGVYIANTLLMEITLVVLYKYLKELFPTRSCWFRAFLALCFGLMPYSATLGTYFCPDYYIPLYLIWLLYAYRKENHLLVSFIGFLMCFTKNTGGLAYGVILLCAYAFTCIYRQQKEGFRWWLPRNIPFARFALWLMPAVLLALATSVQSKLRMQKFTGSRSASFAVHPNEINEQQFISWIGGFRWLILVLVVIAVLMLVVRKWKDPALRAMGEIPPALTITFAALVVAIVLLDGLHSLLTLSHCPRYSAPANVFFVLLLGWAMQTIFIDHRILKNIAVALFSMILLLQCYLTADPLIVMCCPYIDTGNGHRLYSVADQLDYRNLPTVNSPRMRVGDRFVYNYEYSLYSKLDNMALAELDPQQDAMIFLTGRADAVYEFHLSGMQYGIHWDTVKHTLTYEKNENTIHLENGETGDPLANYLRAGDVFYLASAARFDPSELVEQYCEFGSEITGKAEVSTAYGSMTIYEFTKVND